MRVSSTALGCTLAAVLASPPVRAGVLDTPLPTFGDARPALLVGVMPTAIDNNGVGTAVICTNLAAASVDVGLEVFDQTGSRGNTVSNGNGAILGVQPGATVTIATKNSAVLHEDAVITLEPPVVSLRNGSARIVATGTQVGCVALAVDNQHTIADPTTCPTCQPPSILDVQVTTTAGVVTTTTLAGSSTTTTTGPSTTTTSSTTSTTLPALCPSAPRTGCLAPTQPHKARVLLKNNAKALLVWKWGAGTATTLADYGAPNASTQYALCIYDYAAGVAARVAEASVAPGETCNTKPCWRALPNGVGFKYANPLATPDGLTKILLRVGADGKAKIAVKGKGSLLPMPMLPLHAQPRVTVQLVNDGTTCWEASYDTASSNVSTLFKAISN